VSTPSITPAQIKAAILAIIGVAVALGAPISASAQAEVMHVVEILAPAIVIADAVIRGFRAKHVDGVLKAKAIEAASKAAQADAVAKAAEPPTAA
jgi:hypothetical protein